MTKHPTPNAPLQVVESDWHNLPHYDPEMDAGPIPRWVHNVIRSWARGSVEIQPEGYRYIDHREYLPTFTLDGVEWDWRHDGQDVWSLVHILPDADWIDLDDEAQM